MIFPIFLEQQETLDKLDLKINNLENDLKAAEEEVKKKTSGNGFIVTRYLMNLKIIYIFASTKSSAMNLKQIFYNMYFTLIQL